MILNISGRTDICAYYSKWLFNRLKEGFVDVRNPFYPKMVSRIYFSDVDLFVYCTKNPIPMMKYIEELKTLNNCFHITLTPYHKDIEPNVPDKKEVIKTILKLSEIFGKNRIYLRYDPIFINNKYTIEYHEKAFEKLMKVFENKIDRVIISFIDIKKNTKKNKFKELSSEQIEIISSKFGVIAKKYSIKIQTCAEKYDLKKYGIINEPCVNPANVFKLTSKIYSKKGHFRDNCKCLETVDIGVYNTCSHYCKYCYANFDEEKVKNNFLSHDPNSSLLIGRLENDDIIKIRK